MLRYEAFVRFGCFFGILAIMAIWEWWAPRRPLSVSKGSRWFANLGMVLIDTLALRLLLPLSAVAMAALVEERGWGLFNTLSLPVWVEITLGVIVLDLIIYLQHAMFHAIPTFWRLHMVHHTDLDFDVTTALRFHPIEILLSMGIKMGSIAALGISAPAVLIFEMLLNGVAMFNHSNVRLPLAIDRPLRWIVVTPEMHRVHHSVVRKENDSNFGFNLPWWDRLLGTYRAQPEAGHLGMIIGLRPFRDPRSLTLPRLLALPFRH